MQKSSKEVRVTAKTIELAVEEAATRLGVDINRVDYRVVSQTGGGFFSFLGKKVEIVAVLGGGSTKMSSDTDDDRLELSDSEVAELKEDLRQFCSGICRFMTQGDVDVKADIDDGRLILDINDEFLAEQIVKNSKLAESLEHILRKKPRHLKRELPFRIFVDVNGVRLHREKELIEMAHDLSEKVHENKRPIVLNYKSSYDRKIIHMALDKDDRVYTKSIGSGPNRKLMILPMKKSGGMVEDGLNVN